MGDPSSIASSGDYDVYATLAAAKAGIAADGAARLVRCQTAGTLACKNAKGTSVPLPFLAGETQHVLVFAIDDVASTGCVPITVFR